jgi:hypothetical protein
MSATRPTASEGEERRRAGWRQHLAGPLRTNRRQRHGGHCECRRSRTASVTSTAALGEFAPILAQRPSQELASCLGSCEFQRTTDIFQRPAFGLGRCRSRSAACVCIVTGKLSGLVVVDCDAMEDAAFWQEHYPSSPLVVATGGGGVHFYYAMPEGVEIRNRAGVLGRKIDVRGEGGYATAPPSLHPSGKKYAWLAHDASVALPVFDAQWLIDKSQPARRLMNVQTTTVRNAVADIRRMHAKAGEGGHNATFRAACKLRDAG